MRQIRFLSVILIIMLFTGTSADKVWETKYSNDIVTLDYRWIKVGDTLVTRELRAGLVINAPVAKLVKQLKTADDLKHWAAGSSEVTIFALDQSSWFCYTRFDIPKPLRQQDLITFNQVKLKGDATIVKQTSSPDFLPLVDNVSRLRHYSGRWEFIPHNSVKTEVKFYSTSFNKPRVPRFIQDPILQRILANSLVEFKSQAEKQV